MPKGVYQNHARGDRHARWNKEKIISSHGYVKIRVGRSHPLADPNGYAYEHLLVWVSAGNPVPAKNQVIHHLNGNKQDNRIENIKLTNRTDHSVGHNKGLTDDQVRELREMYSSRRLDMPALANKFYIPVSRVSRIVRGEVRRQAGGPISANNRGKHGAGDLLDG